MIDKYFLTQGLKSIITHYCSYNQGLRMNRSCSYVGTLKWWLSFGRHPPKMPREPTGNFNSFYDLDHDAEKMDSDSELDIA